MGKSTVGEVIYTASGGIYVVVDGVGCFMENAGVNTIGGVRLESEMSGTRALCVSYN